MVSAKRSWVEVKLRLGKTSSKPSTGITKVKLKPKMLQSNILSCPTTKLKLVINWLPLNCASSY